MLKENVNPQRTVTGFGTTSARLVLRWTGKPGAKSNAEGEGVQRAGETAQLVKCLPYKHRT